MGKIDNRTVFKKSKVSNGRFKIDLGWVKHLQLLAGIINS